MPCSSGLFATTQRIIILTGAGTWDGDAGAKDNTVLQEIVKNIRWELNPATPYKAPVFVGGRD